MIRDTVFVLGVAGPYCSGKSSVTAWLERAGALHVDVDKLGHEALQAAREKVAARFGPEILSAESSSIDRRALGRLVFGDDKALADLEAIVHPVMIRRVREIIAEYTRRLGAAPRNESEEGEAAFQDSAASPGFGTPVTATRGLPEHGAGKGSAPGTPGADRPDTEGRQEFPPQYMIVLNAALLFKMGLDRLCDMSIWLDAPFWVRLWRGMRRDGQGLTVTLKRMRSQKSLTPQYRRANADTLVVTNLSLKSAKAHVLQLLEERGLAVTEGAFLE